MIKNMVDLEFSFWFDPWLSGKSIVGRFPGIQIGDTDVPKKACDVWRNGQWRLPDHMDSMTEAAWNEVKQYRVREDQ